MGHLSQNHYGMATDDGDDNDGGGGGDGGVEGGGWREFSTWRPEDHHRLVLQMLQLTTLLDVCRLPLFLQNANDTL